MASIEISVSIEDLRKNKIFIATPMYGGICGGQYCKSTADLSAMAAQYGMDVRFFYLFNESLITRARNYLVDEFLRSDCTHLMFIDSDIGFDANDVIALSVIAKENTDKDIVCGPYPKKCIAWEKIKRAVDKGFADKDPSNLEKYVGDYVFNPKEGSGSIALDEPVEVLEGGTGFMMIRRDSLEKFASSFPQYYYKPDHVRTEHFDGSREILMAFQAEVDPVSKRYLSEDYWFCQKAQEIGLKVWLCPWMKLQHTGSYVFGGSLMDLAQIGAGATADESSMPNMTKLKQKQKLKKRK
jgi:hypothetical protein